jgi:uncharacterized protein
LPVPSEASSRKLPRAPRIDSVVFARKREDVRGTSALSSLPRLLAAGVAPEGTLDWQVQGSTGRDEMLRMREFLRVQTRFSPWMTCSRCLEPIRLDDLATDTLFRLAASENQAAREDSESESVEVIAADSNLDLTALVEDEAILALPMAPAHPDCAWDTASGSEHEGNV